MATLNWMYRIFPRSLSSERHLADVGTRIRIKKKIAHAVKLDVFLQKRARYTEIMFRINPTVVLK